MAGNVSPHTARALQSTLPDGRERRMRQRGRHDSECSQVYEEGRRRSEAQQVDQARAVARQGRARRSAGRASSHEEDVTTFLPLVRQVVQQIQAALPASIEHDEVMSWGVDGLLDAFRSTTRPRRRTSRPTRVSASRRDPRSAALAGLGVAHHAPEGSNLSRSAQQLEHHLGRQASQDELASSMGVSMDRLHELMTEAATSR